MNTVQCEHTTEEDTLDSDLKAAVAQAANMLVTDSDAKTLYAQMQGVMELSAKGIPVQLTGAAATLNALVMLANHSRPAFDGVMELVEHKRGEAGLVPLAEGDPDRRAYMREFMASRRQRLGRLVGLWNQLRSERDKIQGATRLAFEQLHGARWKEEKDRREDAMRDTLGRRLSMEERRAIGNQLWSEVEAELDDLERFVREEVRKPLHQRAPNGFQFRVGVLKR